MRALVLIAAAAALAPACSAPGMEGQGRGDASGEGLRAVCSALAATDEERQRCSAAAARVLQGQQRAEDGAGAAAGPRLLAGALERHRELQERMLRGDAGTEKRWLLCEPYGGIGNMLSALVSCYLAAVASERALLINYNNLGVQRPWSPPYEAPLGAILTPPEGLDWSLYNATLSNPDLLDIDPSTQVYLADHAETGGADGRTRFFDSFLCDDMRTTPRHKVLLLRFHGWLPAPLQNPHHRDALSASLPREVHAAHGGANFYSYVSPWLLRPEKVVGEAAAALTSMAGGRTLVALQVRLGLNESEQARASAGRGGGKFEYYHDRGGLGMSGVFVQCAYSSLLEEHRSKPLMWLLVSDSRAARDMLVQEIALAEGGVAASFETRAEDHTRPDLCLHPTGAAAAAPICAGASPGAGGGAHAHLRLLRDLGPRVTTFASGAASVSLTRPVDLSLRGMQHALVELLGMRAAALVVVSENSSFGLAAHGWSWAAVGERGGAPQRGFVVTTGARCYPLPSTEPISDCGILMRDSKARCYSHKMLDYSWSWLPQGYGRSE